MCQENYQPEVLSAFLQEWDKTRGAKHRDDDHKTQEVWQRQIRTPARGLARPFFALNQTEREGRRENP